MNTANKIIKPSSGMLCGLAVLAFSSLLPASGFAPADDQTAKVTTNASVRARPAEHLPADPKLPTLFLIGDSTVRSGQGIGADGQRGWGDFLTPFF